MIARAQVEEALVELRPLVQADGADFELTAVDEAAGDVTLRLVIEDVSCLECILDTELLTTMVDDGMRRRVGAGLGTVTLDDPRRDGLVT